MSGVEERSALALARQQARQQAREQGRQQGREEARQEGLRVMRAALSEMLRQRGWVPVSEEQERLEGCGDLGTLQRWLVQAMSATSVSDALR